MGKFRGVRVGSAKRRTALNAGQLSPDVIVILKQIYQRSEGWLVHAATKADATIVIDYRWHWHSREPISIGNDAVGLCMNGKRLASVLDAIDDGLDHGEVSGASTLGDHVEPDTANASFVQDIKSELVECVIDLCDTHQTAV